MIELKKMTDVELISTFSKVQREMKLRKIVRSKNITGDLGELLAIQFYNETAGLPNLKEAPLGTQNVDALSRAGDRYSIKSATGGTTGVFYGLPEPESEKVPDKKFEFVLVVKLDEDYALQKIYELTWEQFLIMKRWHSRMQAWNLPITKKLEANSTVVFDASEVK